MKLKEAMKLDIRKATKEQREEAIRAMAKAMARRKTQLVVLSYDEHIVSPALRALEQKYNGRITYALPRKNYKTVQEYMGKLEEHAFFMQHWLSLETSTPSGARKWAEKVEASSQKHFKNPLTREQMSTIWKVLNVLQESDATRAKLKEKDFDSDQVLRTLEEMFDQTPDQTIDQTQQGEGTMTNMTKEQLYDALNREPDPHKQQAMIKDWKAIQMANLLKEYNVDINNQASVINAFSEYMDLLESFIDLNDINPPQQNASYKDTNNNASIRPRTHSIHE